MLWCSARRSSCRRGWSLTPCFGSGPRRPKGPERGATKGPSWVSRARAWVAGQAPGPSLDDDPVLWREWRRGRPSRLARIIWGFYFALALAGTAWSVLMACIGGDADIVGLLSGIQATFGLLLVSIDRATRWPRSARGAASTCS